MASRQPDNGSDRDRDAPASGEASALTDPARIRAAQALSPEPGGDAVLNRLAALAMALLRTTAAQVTVLTEVQTVTAGAGLAGHSVGEQTPLAEALCTLTAITDGPMAVSDAAKDPRVSHREPVATGIVGAYLGVPLTTVGGDVIGALCVFEPMARAWTDADAAILSQLADLATADLRAGALRGQDDTRRVLWELSIAAAGVGTFDWDLTTGRLVWDERLVELFGYRRGEFGESIEAFNARLHPDDLPEVTRRLRAAIDTGGDYEATFRVVAPGVPTRWIAARGRALRDESGTSTRVLGAAWDVTATHEAVAEVAAVVEDLAVGFFAVDRDWRFTHVNAEAEVLLMRPRAELVGGDLWELFPDARDSDFETHYRAAMDTGRPARFDAYYPPPLDAWYEVRALPTTDGVSVYFLDVTARRAIEHEAQAATHRAELLARIADELTAGMDPADGASRLAHLAVPALADWAVVTLVEDAHAPGRRRGLRTAAAAHADTELQPLVEAYATHRMDHLTDDTIVVRAMETRTPQVLASGANAAAAAMLRPGSVRDLWLSLGADHVAVYPLTGRSGPMGMLTLCRSPQRGPFSDADLATATHVAARAGVVLENARLYRQQRDLAEGLQRALLTEPPEPDHVQVVVRYVPATEAAQVGGDWYDAFLQANGSTVLVIGDVVGHDTQAAAAMSQVRTMVRTTAAVTGDGPAEVLRQVDQALQTLQVDTTATAVVMRVEQTDDEERRGVTHVRWSNAGHPPPMVIDPDATVTPLSGVRSDLLLGVMPSTRRHEHEVALDRGATVLLYTDGLVERRGQSLEVGLERLEEVLEDLAATDVDLDTLCDQALARLLPERPEDDVALIALRLHPQDRPRPPEAGPRNLPEDLPDAPEHVDQA